MCSGKSTVAAAVAAQLSASFVDLDEVVTQQVGKSPAKIIDDDGEEEFRRLETKFLNDVLKAGSAVIALGGGTWIKPVNRELIRSYHAVTFWLDAPFDLCWRRITAESTDRPLGRDSAVARRLYEMRRGSYELADRRIDANENKSVAEIAAEIVSYAGQ